MFDSLKNDIKNILERDPAARNTLEVVLCYPGFHAILFHRLAHGLWRRKFKLLGRIISQFSRFLTGIEIHPAAKIGSGVFFDHAMGVVIGETAEIGDGCTIYQGVTLGGTTLNKGEKRHPTLGKNVVVSAGAKILGGFTIGDNAKIGSNAVVLSAVPAGSTAVGIPARIIQSSADDHDTIKTQFVSYGVTKEIDPIAQSLNDLVKRIDELEAMVHSKPDAESKN